MTVDALDCGPLGDFPWLPRTAGGRLDVERMPVGERWQRGPDGVARLIDVTPTVRTLDGRLVPVTEVLAP